MKILLLTTHLNIGGIGFYTVNLAKYLKRRNIDVIVVSSGGDLKEMLNRERILHIETDIRTKFEFSFKMLKAVPVLVKLIRKEKIDIIHAQTRVTQVLAWIISKITRVIFLSTCHGFFKSRRFSRRILPCWGDKIIAISASVKEHLSKDFLVSENRIELIRNGIDVSRFEKINSDKKHDFIRTCNWPENTLIIGSVGRLSSVKGFNYLIEAFRIANLKDKRLKLLIVGEGRQEPVLKEQIKAAGLAGEAVFVSGRDSLDYYLSVIDIFCLMSISEGLGLSLMEAMAAGKSCIASRVGGLAELIDDGKDGILVESKNAEQLSAAISCLANDNDLRELLSKNARQKAAENFSIEDNVSRTIEVYEKMTNDKCI
ncbi:MAG: glycosyltransferase family 4 protein [Candidatus Omnitrophota bacterium]